MSREPARTADRVAELRHVFDSAFAQAPATEGAQPEDVLAIRVGPDRYALRLSEVSGLVADKVLTRVPGPVPALLGIAGFRGTIVCVYDLRVLLGYAGGAPPRWLVLTATDATVGLAFDQFEGYWRVPSEAIALQEGAEFPPAQARDVVRIAEIVRPIVPIDSVLDAIEKRAREETAQKER